MVDYPSGVPGAIVDHLEYMRRAGMISDQQCVTLAMAAADVPKGSGRLGSNVHDWRRGDAADAGTLTPGTPVATFLDRSGQTTDRYAGGGSGTPGAGLDHAAVFERYTTDESGRRVGMEVAEQYTGSGGVHSREYRFGEGYGEHNGSNYYAVRTESGPLGNSAATASSGDYLVARQQEREAERREHAANSHSSIAHRGTAAGSDRHLANLREIHGHISALHARVADLEARHERQHRKGVVTDVDATKHQLRMEIGRDCDGTNQVKSPWLPYAQIAGGQSGLNVHSVPTVGEQVMLTNPDGSPDFSQGLIVRHGWYSTNPSPSTDPNADVTVRGTTLNVRSMTSIAHSIGGQLSGQLMSTITGGITRVMDKLGHHLSAPNATVDSSAQTHTHTSTGSHTDTATQDIAHNAGQSATRTAQNGNIDCTAVNGSITHNASKGAITNSALSMSMSVASTLIDIT